MKYFFQLFVLFPLFAFSQTGVHFEHGLNWNQIQAKAKAENKSIFMDCYTTWCGPCKYMSNVIFPQETAGDFFNKNFINVKVQLDTTAGDNEEVVKWYKDAHNISDKYDVKAYPTFLFFDANGKAIHKIVGGSEAEEFVEKSHAALTPETQYYTLLEKYESGEKSPAFLYNFAKASLSAYELEAAGEAAEAYLATQSDLYTKDNLQFISMFTQGSRDKGFRVMLEHPGKVDAVLGDGVAEKVVQDIILKEDVFPRIFSSYSSAQSPQDLPEPNWNELSTFLNQKYPAQGAEISNYSKVVFYMNKNDWKNFSASVQDYMKVYGANATPEQLNNFAWTVFQNCDDAACITEALEWSKRSFTKEQNPAYIDTYANILYKLGRKDEAIKWEQKAMNIAEENSKKSYAETLEKMNRGEKIWD